MEITYRKATPADYRQLTELLQEVHLLSEDLPPALPYFGLAFNNDLLVGSAGIEVVGASGLLRSVAVRPAYQGRGIASRLIDELRREANVSDLYLITTTAEHYFVKMGFTTIDRNDTPEPIRQSQQFSSLCPSSATVMHLGLTALT